MSKQSSALDDDDRDTLVSNRSLTTDHPPLFIELCVEVPKTDQTADPAERVIEALSQSLKALGWRPTVLCAKRSARSFDGDVTWTTFRAGS